MKLGSKRFLAGWRARTLRLVLLSGVLAGLMGGLYFFSPKPDLWSGVSFSRCYRDRNGELLRLTLADDEHYRVFTPLEKVSPRLQEATLLQEDRYFYQHPGVNPVALAKALVNELSGNPNRFGASTITMQLARIHFGLNTRSYTGKVLQILRALQLERHYSKQQILEAYLNRASYGGNLEGIGAAGLVYYGKNGSDLNLAEALTLSVIPQSPYRRTLRNGKEHEDLVLARERLFERWVEIHPEDRARAVDLQLALQVKTTRDLAFKAPHFVEELEASRIGGGTIATTLDLRLQALCEQQIARYVERRAKEGVHNACALLVDTEDMSVLASVGSADYFSKEIEGQVNGMTMRRSPGSALKPFVYGLALDQGLIHPATVLRDAPSSFGGYDPENYDLDFAGPVPAGWALAQSRNVPAVYLASQLKGEGLYGLLREAGIGGLEKEEHYGLTLTLGSAGISPEELAQLYGMLANHGKLRPLRLTMGSLQTEGRSFLSPESSYLVLDMLTQAKRPDRVRSEGLLARQGRVAWKTGTSWAFRDAWSVAVFDRYVLVVWVGNFNGEGNEAFIGRSGAGPLLFSMIDAIRSRQPMGGSLADWEKKAGLGLTEVDICPVSGCLPGEDCPRRIKGAFIAGVSPITKCEVHQRVYIDGESGMRVTHAGPGVTEEVYECWPADIMELFKKAGVSRRMPPPYAGESLAKSARDSGNGGLVITSPKEAVSYMGTAGLSTGGRSAQGLVLTAATARDSGSLYWFADAVSLGRVAPGESLVWNAPAGNHVLRVMDQMGRCDSRTITVEGLP